MDGSSDENLKILFMAGTISGWMKTEMASKNAIVMNDEARYEVCEWFAVFLQKQIKVAISETKKAEAKLTDAEKAIIQKGIFLYRSAMLDFYKNRENISAGIPDKSKEESDAIYALDKKVWSL